MRTAIDIDAEALSEVLMAFSFFGIGVRGSQASSIPGVVRVEIEADWFPDAPLVTCEVSRVAVNHVMQVTARVSPA